MRNHDPARRCAEHGPSLLPYVHGELSVLEAQHVRTHLDGCLICAQIADDLSLGFEQARQWQPEIDMDRLAHLSGRLAAHVPVRRWYAPWALSGALAAMAVGVLWAAMSLRHEVPTAAAPAVVLAPAVIEPEEAVAASAPAAIRRQLSEHLRMKHSEDWQGQTHVTRRAARVHLSSGLALFSFRGGQGRRLEVLLPGAVVRVVGTRFFVERSAEADVSTVGVVQGQVEVQLANTTERLGAGMTLSFDAQGRRTSPRELPGARQGLSDPWLEELTSEETSHAVRRAQPVTKSARPEVSAGVEIIGRLRDAESFARGGQHRAAVDVYTALINDPHSELEPYRDLCRYERARLTGFELGEVQDARRQLLAIAEGAEGEVRRQAMLSLCELDLGERPCQARRCLDEVSEDADFELRREAERLMHAWNLSDVCN